jgi:ABC-type phosphate/phosphonate transport system substrate-binding protein
MKLPQAFFGLLYAMTIATSVAQVNTGAKTPAIDVRGQHRTQLRDISSIKAFKNINRNDARAAVKAWLDVVSLQRGFLADCLVDIVDSVAEIRSRLENHSVEMVTLSVFDYLELEPSGLMVPVLTDTRSAQTGPLYSYVLLVNPASGVTGIGGLRGKHILATSRIGSDVAMAWIDVELGKEKLGRASTYFGSIKFPDKPHACILPLFFGSVDACVVDEISLSQARELNPQLGKLKILARSRPLIESLIAMPVAPFPLQKELIDAMLGLHTEPRGRQLLTVFRTDRLVRLQPGDLDSARELWRDYNRLPGTPNRALSLLQGIEKPPDGGKAKN